MGTPSTPSLPHFVYGHGPTCNKIVFGFFIAIGLIWSIISSVQHPGWFITVTKRSLVENWSERKSFVIESPTTIIFFLFVLNGVFLVTLNCGFSTLLFLRVRFSSKYVLWKFDRLLSCLLCSLLKQLIFDWSFCKSKSFSTIICFGCNSNSKMEFWYFKKEYSDSYCKIYHRYYLNFFLIF